jgi:hypothetical protein
METEKLSMIAALRVDKSRCKKCEDRSCLCFVVLLPFLVAFILK